MIGQRLALVGENFKSPVVTVDRGNCTTTSSSLYLKRFEWFRATICPYMFWGFFNFFRNRGFSERESGMAQVSSELLKYDA